MTIETATAELTAQREDQKTARVLIVDDNSDIVRVMQRILAAEGYDISTAADGDAALKLARERAPDLILLDVMIPKIDGMQVCRELKKGPPTNGTMIILVTGRGSLEHLVQGFQAGADDYIPKPFHIPELLARTRSALRIKRLTDDLAERNRQLMKSQKDLVQKEKMATIGLLASGIAHEFNNIMAGICGYAQLARKDAKYRETLVDVAMTQTERAFELTRSLSACNRANIDEARSNVKAVAQGALCLVAKEVQNSGVQVTAEVDASLAVKMSPGQLQEVILNLVINALQATGNENGRIVVRAMPSDRAAMVRIEVSDNGIGIPEENLGRIFDPFFTTKGPLGGGSQPGTGLGLTVCYNLIQSHGGEIEVESRVGKGTTFRIDLPRCSSTPSAPRLGSASAKPGCLPGRPLRILMVDDEEVSRDYLRAHLEDHEVVCCPKVREALDAYRSKPFDFVILDICLPGSINGFQAFDRFQEFEPPPKVIFASGRFPDAIYRDYIRKAHGHLLKPFKLEDLDFLLGLPPDRGARSSGKAVP